MQNNRNKGTEYEQIAGEYLKTQGVEILKYNFKGLRSEVDIIGKDKDTIIFVEVKYRKNADYGLPYDSVDNRKRARIRLAAKEYLLKNGLHDGISCRFDVISIMGKEIVWLKDAF